MSLSWGDLKGGAPIEITCVDSEPTVAVDGGQLFILERVSDTVTAFSRVDLR